MSEETRWEKIDGPGIPRAVIVRAERLTVPWIPPALEVAYWWLLSPPGPESTQKAVITFCPSCPSR
jgi:hypothetical protein